MRRLTRALLAFVTCVGALPAPGVAAIEKDRELGRRAVESVLVFVTGPIHVPFGRDLALCALAYDLCFESWSGGERARFHGDMNATVDASVPRGALRVADGEITLTIGERRLGFKETSVGGWIESAEEVRPLSKRTE